MQAARRRGGQRTGQLRLLRGKRRRLDSPSALVRFTADVIQDVLAGQVEADVARVCLYGVSIQRQLLEVSDLERRLTDVEAMLHGTTEAKEHARQWPA
jgi:hypothetical protein